MTATQSESAFRMSRATSAIGVSGSTDKRFPGRQIPDFHDSTSYFNGTIRCELLGGLL